MDSSRRLLSFLLLLLVLISAAAAGTSIDGASKHRPGPYGGYHPIEDLRDPKVVEIAKFAVSEHDNEEPDDLVFLGVVSGRQQVVGGINYDLLISARHGVHGPRRNYHAVVYDRPWDNYRSLTYFVDVRASLATRSTTLKNL